MNITSEDIGRLRQIWQEEFDEGISDEEARFHIGRLDTLYLLLSRRPPKD
jgi:hypothetical protein